MTPKTWKNVERRIARYWGAERNPLSGGNGKHTRSDSLHPEAYLEIKHGNGCPATWEAIYALFKDTCIKASKEDKTPVVILHPKFARHLGSYDTYVAICIGSHFRLVCVPQSVAVNMFSAGELQRGCEKLDAPSSQPVDVEHELSFDE